MNSKNYMIVKTKTQNCRKYGLIYKTILYDLENGPDISELYCHQKSILNRILAKSNKRLYALVCCFYKTGYEKFSEEYKLWKSFIPLGDEEFSPIEHTVFKKTIFEQKVKGCYWDLWNGIAEITPDFYTDNYIFFNNQPERFLLIADEEQIKQIKLKLNGYLTEIADAYNSLNMCRNFLQILDDTDCILVELQDDYHEGTFLFYVNVKSKYNNLLTEIFGCEELAKI